MFPTKNNGFLKQAKDILRKEIIKKLNDLSQKQKDIQSKIVVNKVLSSEIFKECQRISIYLSMKNEIYSLPIVKEIFKQGKQCFIPNFQCDEMIMQKLDSWDDYEKLPANKWDIKQPSHFNVANDACLTGGLDLILMPGLAFTKEGHRLGRGKGYYDKYLHKCESMGKRPKTVALLFKEQLVESIPVSEHDKLVDSVIYPTEEEIQLLSTQLASNN